MPPPHDPTGNLIDRAPGRAHPSPGRPAAWAVVVLVTGAVAVLAVLTVAQLRSTGEFIEAPRIRLDDGSIEPLPGDQDHALQRLRDRWTGRRLHPADEEPAAPLVFPAPDGGDAEAVSEWPLALVEPRTVGVFLVPVDAPEQALLLDAEAFQDVAWAIPDQRGGLIFQHLPRQTPEPWEQGAVLWLPAGAAEPVVLVPPASRPEGIGEYPIAGVWPVGVAEAPQGRGLFIHVIQTGLWNEPAPLMVAELVAGGPTRQIARLDRGPDGIAGEAWLLAGGDVVAYLEQPWLNERGEYGCATVTLLRAEDGAAIPSPSECLPGGWPGQRVLHRDGDALAWIHVKGGVIAVTVIDLTTGAVLEERALDVADSDSWADFGLVSSPGGWLVYADTDTELRLLDLDGQEHARIDKSLIPRRRGARPQVYVWSGEVSVRFTHRPFELAP